MLDFYRLVAEFFSDILALLNYFTFDFGGVKVSLLAIFLGFAFISFAASAFWKGAKK